jgi:TonB-linked SusC/RagA family outer membrane protein
LFTSVTAFAQTGSITGTVTNAETGEPVLSANVFIQQLQRGAATDADGEFTISNIPVGSYELRITYVGYKTYNEQVQIQPGENEVSVELQSGSVGLDELIVTGYGTELESELTTAISSVQSEEFENVPVQNAAGILQGRAAGVKVTTTSGTPGGGFNVQIRGQGSINSGTRPLYIVDGVQISFSNQNGTNDNTPLNAIPPSNIESVQVLKDAAAASIYGARAANGVVIIETNRGQSGATQVSASVSRGATSRIQNNDYFSRDQFIEYFQAAIQYDNPGVSAAAVDNFFRTTYLPQYGFAADTDFNDLPDTDWFEYNARSGVSSNYNLTVSGGSEESTYRISGNFEDTDGYIPGNNFQNYAFTGNFDQQVSSKFSTRQSIKLSSQKFVGPCQDGFFINCPISQAAFLSPLAQARDSTGAYSQNFPFIGATNNPAVVLNETSRETSVLQILGSFGASYNFTNWLTAQTLVAMDYRKEDESIFANSVANPADGGSLTEISAPISNFQVSGRLNFNRALDDKNTISGLVGAEYRRDYTRQIGASGIGFPVTNFNVLNTTATPTGAFGFNNEFRTAGYFANVKYNYDDRYLVNITGRYDGSSRFGQEVRFGFFPSASAKWSISDEDFFESDLFETLQLRASYGITGNSLLGRYPARALYSTSGSYNGTTGLRPSQLGNQQLSWEQAATLNFGLDYSMLSGRISGSIDVYQEDTDDLLLGQPLPVDSGFGSITRNIGEIRNEGIEFTVRTVNIRTDDFTWRSNFNFGVNRNEVLSLNEGLDALFPSGTQPVEVGQSIDHWKVVQYAGVNPADGRPFWYTKDGDLTYNPDTVDDRVGYDGAEEDVNGGLRNAFSFKGLTLSAFFQFSYGQRAIPQQITAFGISQVGGSQTNGIEQRLTEAWREPGDVKPFPAPSRFFTYPNSGVGYFLGGTDKIYDASYIRLKDVTVSYNLPASLTESLSLGNVRLYATGLNLVTWTSYIGFDPEIAGDITQGSIPVGRTVRGGIEVQF